MPVIRFFWRIILQVFFSVVALVVGIAGIGLALCVLAVALVCALFLAWTVILLVLYATTHDPQWEHAAVQAIMIAAGSFGIVVVFWHCVGSLFTGRGQGQPPALYLAEPDAPFDEPVAATASRRGPIWTDRRPA